MDKDMEHISTENPKMSIKNLILPFDHHIGHHAATPLVLPLYDSAAQHISVPMTTVHVHPYSRSEPQTKRLWTKNEDLMLRNAVKEEGIGAWANISLYIPGRTGKQVRERWLHHLAPDISKEPWTNDEDDLVLRQQREIGNRWSIISKLLRGRSENAVKNRYYTVLKPRISKKKKENGFE